MKTKCKNSSVSLRKSIEEVNEEVFNWGKCEFETKSQKGLNIHKKFKHPINIVSEICEKQFNSPKAGLFYFLDHGLQLS